jgi:lipopolysaccharide transport system permease protein
VALAVPVLVALIILTTLGVSVWLSALDVQYRDVRYAVPFFMQVWLFASPVIYSAADVPERWRPVLALNPMTGAIEGFRWAAAMREPRDAPRSSTADYLARRWQCRQRSE